jgi:hypothetical protein
MTKKKTTRANPSKGTAPAALVARQREGLAIKMRLNGATLDEIATQAGYASRSGAAMALARAKARLSPIEDIEELRRLEVARTYEVEQEAWEQWYRSTDDAVKKSVKETAIQLAEQDEPGEATRLDTTTTREGQTGNPALLDKILKAMERRAKLLGLDASEHVNVRAGVRVVGQNREEIFAAALARIQSKKEADA